MYLEDRWMDPEKVDPGVCDLIVGHALAALGGEQAVVSSGRLTACSLEGATEAVVYWELPSTAKNKGM